MRANTLKACLSCAISALLAAPVLAGEAPEPAAGAVASAPGPSALPQPAAGPAPAVQVAWPGSVVPAVPPPQLMPLFMRDPRGAAVGMWVPVPVRMAPGFPPGLTWVPVVLVPMPLMAPAAPALTEAPDYGPLSDAPVVELPPPPDAEAQAVGADAILAAGHAPAPQGPAEDGQAGAAWRAPEVDYGPISPAPVVDLLQLEKQLSAPAIPGGKSVSQSRPKPQATAKPAAGQKKRMCWENGVVAPCK